MNVMQMNVDGAVLTPAISQALRDLQKECGPSYMDAIDDAIDLILAFSSGSDENISSDGVLHTIQNLRFVSKQIERLMGNDVFFNSDRPSKDDKDHE